VRPAPIPWLILLLAPRILAQDVPAQDEAGPAKPAPWKAELAARWNEVRAFVPTDGEPRAVERIAEPIFSYAESAREDAHYGTLWAWGRQGRPVALLALGMDIDGPARGFELVALTGDVSVVMHDGWKWTPQASALDMQDFPSSPSAATNEPARLIQIKSLARKFDVAELLGGERSQLRLLPTPVYRYHDAAHGLLDGAFFLFAHGTNPEALLAIECRTSDDGTAWSYGFVPLAAAEVTAQLNDQVVWTKPSTPGPRRQDPYSTWLETGAE
jgi:hypothetical protein